MDGRRQTGGKLEVKIRVRNPILTKQMEQINEKWVVIDYWKVWNFILTRTFVINYLLLLLIYYVSCGMFKKWLFLAKGFSKNFLKKRNVKIMNVKKIYAQKA